MGACLVIGGAGFIGRHVTRRLCESGRDVTVLGRRAEPERPLHAAARYRCGDYGDRGVLQKLLKPGIEIVDLAYATVPKTSFENPVFDLVSNLPATVGLFQEVLEANAGRIVMVSSGGTVYGPSESKPIPETHPAMPVSPYGITKLTTERYAMMFHYTQGLPVVVARPANAYGEEQRGETGQGFIAAAISSILLGREIEIFGNGGSVRDYIHVDDVAAGIVAALEHGTDGDIYNIGTGIGTSNAEIVQMLGVLAAGHGLSVRTRRLPARGFDVDANILNSTKLRKLAGWKPRVPLFEGLAAVWNAKRIG